MNSTESRPPGAPEDGEAIPVERTETIVREEGAPRSQSGPQVPLPAARTIGRYSIIDHLGSGGMGSVYTAYDPDLDRKVALKLVRSDREGPEEQARLLREARALGKLEHPNVVRVYDVGLHGEEMFFTMEFISGNNLRHWVTEERPDWPRVARLFLGVADGLVAAHGRGLIHRDLKPENILIGNDGAARIADFGLVRARTDKRLAPPAAAPGRGDAGTTMGETGLAMGTPAYMAPELGPEYPADERSDQYAFCMSLHYALHGEIPSDDQPLEPPGRRDTVPVNLRKLVQRGLSADPARRFPSMSALGLELRRISRGFPRRRVAAGVGMAVLVGALGWLAFLGERADSPCRSSAERMAGIWDAERRQGLERDLAATGSPFAGQALAAVTPLLDRYRSEWIDTHREACLATRVRGEQSENLLDLRMLCLERRREELRSLADLLARQGKTMMPTAVRAAERLSPISDCNDRAELALLSPLPPTADVREEIERLQAGVAEQGVRLSAGESVELEVLKKAVEGAEALAYPPLAAAAGFELGFALQHQKGETDGAIETLEEALRDAVAGNDRVLAAKLYGRLAENNAYNRGDIEKGQWWSQLAEAALQALGQGHDSTRMRVQASLGMVQWSAGRFDEAESHWQRALALSRETEEPSASVTTEMLNNLALIPSKTDDEKLEYLRASLDLKQRTFGDWNPLLANTLVNFGAEIGRVGRYEESGEIARQAAKILLDFYGEHRDLAYPWTLEAEILNRLDRPEEAQVLLERALEVAHDFGDRHPLLVQIQADLAEALLLQLRIDDAEAAYRTAAMIARDFPEGHPYTFLLALTGGRVDLLQGRVGSALRRLEIALPVAGEEGRSDSSHADLLILPVALGESHRALGRPDLARPHFETAVERADRLEVQGALKAAARFALADLIEEEEEARARSLAEQAASEIAGAQSAWSRSLAEEIATWLDSH